MSTSTSRLVRLTGDRCRALVYPELGFQLHGYEVEVGGRWVEVIHGPGGPVEPADRRYGNPILFPCAGVSNGARPDAWSWEGRDLPMPQHGWARNVYWQVEAIEAHAVSGLLLPHAGFQLAFPFDFALRARYALEAEALVLTVTLENTGDTGFPYSLGFHPYLRAPLIGGTRESCTVELPAGVRLRSIDGWRSIDRAASEARVLAATSPELPTSIVLGESGVRTLALRHGTAGLKAQVSVEASEQDMPVWVLWTGAPDASYLCLEPWTDAPNALDRPGTRRLDPGQVHRYRMTIAVEATG